VIEPSSALKADGSIKAWGDPSSGGTGAPAGNDYTKIYSTDSAFAALKADGSILNKSWYSHYQRVRLYLQNLSHPTPGFIQLAVPLPPLKPMAQSRRGVTQILEAPHAAIEPSVLMTAKACQFE
jgi:hypothetical protein